jgi:hypothetical protein
LTQLTYCGNIVRYSCPGNPFLPRPSQNALALAPSKKFVACLDYDIMNRHLHIQSVILDLPDFVDSKKATLASDGPRHKTQLPINFAPSINDVICGKGLNVFSHEGNRRFRHLLDGNLDCYRVASTRGKKAQVVMEIVSMVRMNGSNGGGFVRQDKHGRWWEIGCNSAKEKVGHTIREALLQHEPNRQVERRKARANNLARRKALKNKDSVSPALSPTLIRSAQVDSLHQLTTNITDIGETTTDPPTTREELNSEEFMDIPPPPLLSSQSSEEWFSRGEMNVLGSMPATDHDFDSLGDFEYSGEADICERLETICSSSRRV